MIQSMIPMPAGDATDPDWEKVVTNGTATTGGKIAQ